jgi:hypothetical protein
MIYERKEKEYEQDAQKLMHELKNPPMIYEGKEVAFPQGFEKAQVLNRYLKLLNDTLFEGMYDFGGGNFLAPLPNTMNLNGKDMQPYIVVFEPKETQ